MEEYLKPERLDTPPNTPLSNRILISKLLVVPMKIIDPNVHTDLDKINTLINCISSDVYEYIAECDTFVGGHVIW